MFMYLRYIPNDTLKWLKNSRFYGSIDGIFDVSLSKLQPRKEAQMGKSLNGKELETGLRIGELMALTWSDIDMKKKMV